MLQIPSGESGPGIAEELRLEPDQANHHVSHTGDKNRREIHSQQLSYKEHLSPRQMGTVASTDLPPPAGREADLRAGRTSWKARPEHAPQSTASPPRRDARQFSAEGDAESNCNRRACRYPYIRLYEYR
jgi:hypothetical protein